MQENELVARLANAIVGYERARQRLDAARREFSKLTAQEEMCRLMLAVAGDNRDVVEHELETLDSKALKCIDECEVWEEQARKALQELSRIGMLADGLTLREIDAHFRKEDAEDQAIKREIRRRVAESVDRNL